MKTKKKRSKLRTAKFYSQLTPQQLDRIAAPFEKEMVRTKPLTPVMWRQERRAKRKRGRPVVGEGAAKVLVTLERGLLREADSFAKKHNKNRSQVVADALRAMVSQRSVRRAS